MKGEINRRFRKINMKENKRIVFGVLLICLLISTSYLFEKVYTKYGQVSAKIIKVTNKDKVVALISADVLKQLMEKNTELDEEDTDRGPSLLSTINATGINRFEQIEVKGKNQNDILTLNKEQVNKNYELYLSSNGTVNLYLRGNSSKFLVKEVMEINIRG